MLRRVMMAGASSGGAIPASILAKAQLWWTFDDTMIDAIEGLAISTAGTYIAGKKGQAVQAVRGWTGATGVSGYEASGFTLCGWVRVTGTSNRVLFGFARNSAGGEAISLDHVSGGIGGNYRNAGGNTTLTRIPVSNNVWLFFALSWLPGSGTTGELRTSINNGTPVSATKTKAAEFEHEFFQLGSAYSNTQPGCDLDEMLFTLGPLTSEELSYLYNGGAGRSYAEVLAAA